MEMSFGDLIKRIRKQMGHTLESAVGYQMDPATLSRIESGRTPSRENFMYLKELYGLHEMSYEQVVRESELKIDALKESIALHLKNKNYEMAEEDIQELENSLNVEISEDLQFKIFAQIVWWEGNGLSIEDCAEKCIRLFEVKKNMPKPEQIEEGSYSYVDQLILNQYAVQLGRSGEHDKAESYLSGLEKYMKNAIMQHPKMNKRVVIIIVNRALFEMKRGNFERALERINDAIKYVIKAESIDLCLKVLNLKQEILKSLDRSDELKNLSKFNCLCKEVLNNAGINVEYIFDEADKSGISMF